MNFDENPVRDRLIALFAEAAGPVSGEELSHALGLSRTAIWKQIKALEQVGFAFAASPRVGYRAVTIPDELMAPLVEPHLPLTASLGRPLFWAAERASTNVTALEWAAQGLPHGSVVTAAVQTGGKGRRERAWVSPQGGMWFSVLVRQPCALHQAPDLTLLASLAVWRALAESGVSAEIKWPNDILVAGKKVCGILAQMRADGEWVDHAVIGIGINANFPAEQLPEEIRHRATTILSACGFALERPRVLAAILTELDRLYRGLATGEGFASVRREWLAHCQTIGRDVEVAIGNEIVRGKAVDVDDQGSLLVELADGNVRQLHSGEVLFSGSENLR
ncbi:biotin/acetyl-CoA-carboxylase ligase [Alicyclobacillus hesperidum URH17-3-68]|uniref:biotin--[acetyl-CoA-carboxylase] ligase n=1 Tax=Alicyclobacillus hesperidum TaxID=89784 RepID=UPI0002819C22|nr:biotin--[acetyl-CoA-carboxylase] ligase [Alicyclobacillus hesperidum]EJY55047.1 biotin/acetyl-CoA-carboxylase ligase [Alicyclobacillus hesperidum URH17-3-68]